MRRHSNSVRSPTPNIRASTLRFRPRKSFRLFHHHTFGRALCLMTLEEDQALSRADYWDGRYKASDNENPTHEWFRGFDALAGFFEKNLFCAAGITPCDKPKILHLGSGDSTIPADLARRGYADQLCVDFSPVVVQLMTERHRLIPGIEWRNVDVRAMDSIVSKSINVAFDKGTLDAMIHGSPWNPPQEVKENTGSYLREVHRILADNGVFLYVTFRQPHFMRPLLNADGLWNLDMQTLSAEGTFDYYGYVITKASRTCEH